jgi:hypothetical protein
MAQETKKAIVIASNKEVIVYSLKKGGYCDFSDCKTEYKENELKLI